MTDHLWILKRCRLFWGIGLWGFSFVSPILLFGAGKIRTNFPFKVYRSKSNYVFLTAPKIRRTNKAQTPIPIPTTTTTTEHYYRLIEQQSYHSISCQMRKGNEKKEKG